MEGPLGFPLQQLNWAVRRSVQGPAALLWVRVFGYGMTAVCCQPWSYGVPGAIGSGVRSPRCRSTKGCGSLHRCVPSAEDRSVLPLDVEGFNGRCLTLGARVKPLRSRRGGIEFGVVGVGVGDAS